MNPRNDRRLPVRTNPADWTPGNGTGLLDLDTHTVTALPVATCTQCSPDAVIDGTTWVCSEGRWHS